MNTDRIKNIVDVKKLQQSRVAVIGIGGSMEITEGLVRCGVGSIIAIDPDTIEASNVARQGHDEIGEKKVRAAEKRLRKINSKLDFLGIALRHDQIPEMHWKELLTECDLLILATDSFEAQSFGNRLALTTKTPALWIGLYAGATAGEIVWWTPSHADCFRCLLERRYLRQKQNQSDPGSDDALFQDLQIVDGIAGQIALGLLTRGSDNYFGRLIDRLGPRQFLQIKLRHDWLLDGVDPVAKALQIPADNDSYFCWSTSARMNGPRLFTCPDCEQLLGRRFEDDEFIEVEIPSSSDSENELDCAPALDRLGL